jgi:dTDP-L-rhamnose 4-epimerase
VRKKLLITGGAGFIGSNLIMSLDQREWEIIVLDSLLRQVHTTQQWTPPREVRFVKGDVCNRKDVRACLAGVDFVVHLAAETGVGQSAYELARHVKTNEYGTAVLLEEASRLRGTLKRVIVASSRAVYGEGMAKCHSCGPVASQRRNSDDLTAGQWEPRCPLCTSVVSHIPSRENDILAPTSVYGVTKVNQEQLLQQFSSMFNVAGISLRFQNVYGPGQSLNNPYTGILAVFSTRALSKNPIYIYEDGQESRDFVFVEDAARAIVSCLQKDFSQTYQTFNVGLGQRTSVYDIAKILIENLKVSVPITISGKFRVGDIRHACADISKIQNELGFSPRVDVSTGLKHFSDWAKSQPLPDDQYEKTENELFEKGLLLQKRGYCSGD